MRRVGDSGRRDEGRWTFHEECGTRVPEGVRRGRPTEQRLIRGRTLRGCAGRVGDPTAHTPLGALGSAGSGRPHRGAPDGGVAGGPAEAAACRPPRRRSGVRQPQPRWARPRARAAPDRAARVAPRGADRRVRRRCVGDVPLLHPRVFPVVRLVRVPARAVHGGGASGASDLDPRGARERLRRGADPLYVEGAGRDRHDLRGMPRGRRRVVHRRRPPGQARPGDQPRGSGDEVRAGTGRGGAQGGRRGTQGDRPGAA